MQLSGCFKSTGLNEQTCCIYSEVKVLMYHCLLGVWCFLWSISSSLLMSGSLSSNQSLWLRFTKPKVSAATMLMEFLKVHHSPSASAFAVTESSPRASVSFWRMTLAAGRKLTLSFLGGFTLVGLCPHHPKQIDQPRDGHYHTRISIWISSRHGDHRHGISGQADVRSVVSRTWSFTWYL